MCVAFFPQIDLFFFLFLIFKSDRLPQYAARLLIEFGVAFSRLCFTFIQFLCTFSIACNAVVLFFRDLFIYNIFL